MFFSFCIIWICHHVFFQIYINSSAPTTTSLPKNMSQKRKAEEDFQIYLTKKSRLMGIENIDLNEEFKLFDKKEHPVQLEPDKAFDSLTQFQVMTNLRDSVLYDKSLDQESILKSSTQISNNGNKKSNAAYVPKAPSVSNFSLNKTFSAFDSQFSIGNQNNLNQSFSLYGGGVGQASLISTIEPEILAQSQKIINQVDRETDQEIISLPAHVCHVLTVNRGLTSLYPWQKKCLKQENVRNFKSLCYQVPTGGGKSLVAEILILKQIFQKKLDAIMVLPYVSLVQEKVAAFSLLGTKLDFFVDEYAAGKGILPPVKRRKDKRTIYICTIEKANMLIDSMTFLNRVDEVGIAVIDEVHMIYEQGIRGGYLESLITKLKNKNQHVQLVGMSATIPNIRELGKFLNAQIFTGLERPIDLVHYIKDEDKLYKCTKTKTIKGSDEIDFLFQRNIDYDNNDRDGVIPLIWEATENKGNCIIFCSSKKQCEILAQSYAKMTVLKDQNLSKIYESGDFSQLPTSTQTAFELLENDAYGQLCPVLRKCVPVKAAYHHAGLTPDERRTIEEMYSQGQINALFATSTVAAGVNLGATRVIVRSPKVGILPLDPTKYRQMAGRAGRAGKNDFGECILIIPKSERSRILKDQNCTWTASAGFNSSIDPFVASFSKNLIHDCLPTGVSQLDSVFTEFILASLCGKLFDDMRTCLRLISSTLWSRSWHRRERKIKKKDKNEQESSEQESKSRSQSSTDEILEDVINKLKYMENEGLIFIKPDKKQPENPKLFISRLGNACIRSGMTPSEVLNSIARLRGSLHPIYLSSVISLVFLAIDQETSERFIGFKRGHRDRKIGLYEDLIKALNRLTPSECDVLKKYFSIDFDSIQRKIFGMSVGGGTGASTTRKKSDDKEDTSQASTISTSSYKDLEKSRQFLIAAAKSIPKQPVYDETDLENRLISTLAVYECRIKKIGVQKISEFYNSSRGDVQQLCSSASANCGKLARFCEVIHEGDQAASLLKEPETEEMTIMVDASQSLWVLAPLFRNLTTTLKYGSLGDLVELLDIPNIGLGRARQLYRNGYTSLDKLANADCNSLVRKLGTSAYMPKKLAMKILSAARNKVRDRLDISEEKYFEDQKKARFYDFGLNQ